MKPKAELLSLPEELLTYILSFLPWQDILCCTSLCKALRRTYLSSSELQYIAELGSQQLIPVSKNHISFSKCLQLLRDNIHAWFKFDLYSFETISIPKGFHMLITNGHACFWEPFEDFVRIFPILPKPSEKTIERNFSPAQNLLAIAHSIRIDNYPSDEDSYIELLTLDGDGTHTQAAGRTLFMPDLWLPRNRQSFETCSKLEGFGRHIAFLRFVPLLDDTDSPCVSKWWLQIWDWQYSTSSNQRFKALFDRGHVPVTAVAGMLLVAWISV
ncbi:hypothetical protein BDR04DRAFT_1143262 [Suillus decipiens]|nr:hypothetical protein BDR04DRAFT_1143262 [Suillus decipiens]